jgi:hypothetical protein
MFWNTANSLDDLEICPWCKDKLPDEIEITKSGRKKTECSCGCVIFESSKKIWFTVEPTVQKESKTNLSNYYDNEKTETNYSLTTSSSGGGRRAE